MIYDTFENIELYCKKGDALYRAITYARDFDRTLPDGEYEVQGRDLFAKVMTYQTEPAEERKFEAHKKYTDIQVMFTGKERMDAATGQELVPIGAYDAETDFALLEPSDEYAALIMEPGKFVVFFPHDFHRPNCSVDGNKTVRKVCMKLRISADA